MSLSLALSNAMSGLGATGRQTQAVSSNIANALTPGYGRREVMLAPSTFGGVQISGIDRAINASLLSDRRQADAALGDANARASALAAIASGVGSADDPSSLSGRVAQLEATLIEAASQPGSGVRLQSVANAANGIATTLNSVSQDIQKTRISADASIASDVERLRIGLERIDSLNNQIVRLSVAGQPDNGLLDQRQIAIDSISDIVPVRELPRANGAIGLTTTNGQILLNDRPVELEFTPSPTITPQTVVGAALSTLTVDGQILDMSDPNGRMSGGSLAANFDVRDEIAPALQAELDAFARDLINRFDDPALDPTKAPTDPGLFSDRGSQFNVADEVGISGRIELNTLVSPTGSGEVWRLRSGLGAVAPGPAGDAQFLNTMSDALTNPQLAASGSQAARELSVGSRAGAVLSDIAGSLFQITEERAFTLARTESLRNQELAGGVDTDQELQKLLLLEQAYTANAKIIEAADSMLQRLLEI